MIIHKFTPFIPANVKLELDDGHHHDIFVLVSLSPLSVQVPDEKQYELVKHHLEKFKTLIGEYLSRPVEVNIPGVPAGIMEQAKIIRLNAEKREKELKEEHQRIEIEAQEMKDNHDAI